MQDELGVREAEERWASELRDLQLLDAQQRDEASPEEARGMTVQDEEPLVQLARVRPAAALRFLWIVLVLGCVVGLSLAVLCAAFLHSSRWAACGPCGRPLDVWIIAHCTLQFLQVPPRMHLLWQFHWRQVADHTAASRIHELTTSRSWGWGGLLAMASYCWCVVGIVWLLNSNFCSPCPDLYRLTFGMMALAVLKPCLTLAAFRKLSEGQEQPPPPKGAREEVIASLPLLEYLPSAAEESQTSCAVCLCDFDSGEKLRHLPCGHKFHKDCIDTWLRRNKACPLCMYDAELPPPRRRRQQHQQLNLRRLWKGKGD